MNELIEKIATICGQIEATAEALEEIRMGMGPDGNSIQVPVLALKAIIAELEKSCLTR